MLQVMDDILFYTLGGVLFIIMVIMYVMACWQIQINFEHDSLREEIRNRLPVNGGTGPGRGDAPVADDVP